MMQSAQGPNVTSVDGRYLPTSHLVEYPNMGHHGHHGHLDPSHLHYSQIPIHSGVLSSNGRRDDHLQHLHQSHHPSIHHSLASAGGSSDEETSLDVKPLISEGRSVSGRGTSLKGGSDLSVGKKTKGRVKIKMEFIDNKLRRYTTFSKRKTGIMKKAYELSTLTGTQVMLLVASETGHVYTFATRKLQPMITSDAGKALIQTCLNSPDPPPSGSCSLGGGGGSGNDDQRMSATGFEETELSYNVVDDEQEKVRQMMYNSHYSPSSQHNLFSRNHHHHHIIPSSSSSSTSSSSHIHTSYNPPSSSPSPYGMSLSSSLTHSPNSPPYSHIGPSHSSGR